MTRENHRCHLDFAVCQPRCSALLQCSLETRTPLLLDTRTPLRSRFDGGGLQDVAEQRQNPGRVEAKRADLGVSEALTLPSDNEATSPSATARLHLVFEYVHRKISSVVLGFPELVGRDLIQPVHPALIGPMLN